MHVSLLIIRHVPNNASTFTDGELGDDESLGSNGPRDLVGG